MVDRINDVLSQASSRIMNGIAEFLPGLLALLVIIAVTIAVGVLVRILLRRFLRGIRFDEHIANWGLPEMASWSPQRSPTLLVTRIVYWMIMLVGLLVGLSALDAALTSALAIQIFSYIPNVLAALLVLTVGTFAARFLGRSVLISAVNLRLQSARLLSLGVKWMVMVLTAAMALEHLGIGGQIVTLSFGILFGGIVLALALAVGLGSKDMVSRTWEQQRSEEEPEEKFQHM